MIDFNALETMLLHHEGLVLKPYTDQFGKLTIGAGRNLDDHGISRSEALDMLHNDIAMIVSEISAEGFWQSVKDDDVRARALIDMAFNLGMTRFLDFKVMLRAVAACDWKRAAAEMLNSKWAKQVGPRAVELADMIRQG